MKRKKKPTINPKTLLLAKTNNNSYWKKHSGMDGIWQAKHRLHEQDLEEAQENLSAYGWDTI